jgi:hypothetical protein
MIRSEIAEVNRTLVYRRARQIAIDDGFHARLTDFAAALSLPRTQIKYAIASMIGAGIFAVEQPGSGARPALYRILRPLRIVTVPAVVTPPPRKIKAAWFTPEREAVLTRLWPGYLPNAMVRAELRKLPGEPVPNASSVNSVAARLGLRRPTDILGNADAIAGAVREHTPAVEVPPWVAPARAGHADRVRLVPRGTYPAPAGGFSMGRR